MTNPMIRIHDTNSGEIIDREMSKEEFEAYKNGIESIKMQDAKKQNDREKALAKLAALGLTEDEIAAL